MIRPRSRITVWVLPTSKHSLCGCRLRSQKPLHSVASRPSLPRFLCDTQVRQLHHSNNDRSAPVARRRAFANATCAHTRDDRLGCKAVALPCLLTLADLHSSSPPPWRPPDPRSSPSHPPRIHPLSSLSTPTSSPVPHLRKSLTDGQLEGPSDSIPVWQSVSQMNDPQCSSSPSLSFTQGPQRSRFTVHLALMLGSGYLLSPMTSISFGESAGSTSVLWCVIEFLCGNAIAHATLVL